MKKIIFLLISFIFYFWITHANNESFSSWLSIKELSKNIENLKEEKNKLQTKTNELNKEYWELISFIKTDLTDDDFKEIKYKINLYSDERNLLEIKLKNQIENLEDTTKIKKEIILQKANLYKFLAKYVDKIKRNDFIEHIKFNIQATKERKDLIEEITINQILLDEKLTFIKGKIEIHKEDLQNKIETTLATKIIQRINEIDTDEKYKLIDKKAKNIIYENFIKQIIIRVDEIKKNDLISDNYKEIRINVLKKMINEVKTKIKI